MVVRWCWMIVCMDFVGLTDGFNSVSTEPRGNSDGSMGLSQGAPDNEPPSFKTRSLGPRPGPLCGEYGSKFIWFTWAIKKNSSDNQDMWYKQRVRNSLKLSLDHVEAPIGAFYTLRKVKNAPLKMVSRSYGSGVATTRGGARGGALQSNADVQKSGPRKAGHGFTGCSCWFFFSLADGGLKSQVAARPFWRAALVPPINQPSCC